MKLLVIQEQHFVRMPNNQIWVNEQSNIAFWERYLDVFEEVVVCARFRKSKDNNTDGLMRSDRPRVSFVEMPDFRGVLGVAKEYIKIKKQIKNAISEADCVLFRAPSPISMVAYSIVKNSKKPYSIELVNNPRTCYSAQAMHTLYQPILAAIITNQTKRMCKNANGVAYVSEHTLQDLYPCRHRLFPDDSRFFEAAYSTIRLDLDDYTAPSDHIELPKPVVLVHSGKMVDNRKGQKVFIETLAILREKGYQVYGILIGDGPKRSEFESLAYKLGVSNYIEFTGWMTGYAKIKNTLLKSHIFVFPSIGEGLPRSVLEAMANGLICVASAVDGICELVDEDGLVHEYKAEAFASKIEFYLTNWNCTKDIRDKLYKKSINYNYDVLRQRRTSFYKKLKELTMQRSEDGSVKHVLHVLGSLQRGGAETMVMNLYRNIDKTRIQFDFLVKDRVENGYEQEVLSNGGTIYCVESAKKIGIFANIYKQYKVMKSSRIPYQAVHVHTNTIAGLSLLAATLAQIKVRVCHSHTAGFSSFVKLMVGRILILLFTNRYIACGLLAGRVLYGSHKFHIVHNAIDLDNFVTRCTDEKLRLREKLGFGSNEYIILHIGRYEKPKNHKFIMQVALMLKKTMCNFSIVLLGNGSKFLESSKLVEELDLLGITKMLGTVDNCNEYLKACDLFILPSLYEGLPVTVIEAQTAGVKCLLSDSITTEADLGLNLVEFLNLDAVKWAKRICQLQADNQSVISTEEVRTVLKKRGYDVKENLNTIYDLYGLCN